MDRIKNRLSSEELEVLDRVLEIIDKELMPEIHIGNDKEI